ncbi:MAG: WYL domain-containing protein [Thermoflavifilum sp.]|nr:WYL domain-containing protein [Thermoflavifilum sp.]
MPINKDAYARYRLIDERLNRRLQPPTLSELIDYVSEKLGKRVSKRTIQQDIYDMRYSEELGYKAPIVYDHQIKGYRYEEADYSIHHLPVSEYDLEGLEIAINILQHYIELPFIKQFEETLLRIADHVRISKQLRQSKPFLHIDQPSDGSYKGINWLNDLTEAIKTCRLVRLSYQSFRREVPKEYLFAPYHIREYQHRFYVVGKSVREENAKIRTFALDRIRDLWPTYQTFEYPEEFDDRSFFGNIIGISDPEKDPEDIELWFEAEQSKYILSQPIHASQRLIEQTPEGCRIGLKLVINHELLMLLLSYGARVKVLSPAHLQEKIRTEIQQMANLYASQE